MNGLTDLELLRDYAERGAEPAFGELVRRHVDLVYSAALRMVRDAAVAEDVTQGVFLALAKGAGQLTERPVLSGWLHSTAQHLAANAVRADVRRRAREQEAAAMNELLAAEPDVPWEQIAPHLDAALGQLSEPERDAVLLRYFERKSAREMAEVLGTTEQAAQKRLNRAIEHLRDLLAERGVAAGAGGLAVLLSANAVQAAPAGLAFSITAAAAVGGTAVAALTTSTVVKTAAMTTLQKTLLATTLAVALGGGTYEAYQASHLRTQVAALRQQLKPVPPQPSNDASLATLEAKVATLETRNGELTNALTQANAEKGRVEIEREQARRSAALFKELADMAAAKDKNPTNEFPTPRHVWTAWGHFARVSSQLMKDKDASTLSAEEKAARDTAVVKLLEQFPKLIKAMKEFDLNKPAGSETDEMFVDGAGCFLYGALNLDEHQFQDMYALMQRYGIQAKEQKLKDAKDEKPTPEAGAAWKKMLDDWKAEAVPLLTSEQVGILEAILPHIKTSSRDFNFNFNF